MAAQSTAIPPTSRRGVHSAVRRSTVGSSRYPSARYESDQAGLSNELANGGQNACTPPAVAAARSQRSTGP